MNTLAKKALKVGATLAAISGIAALLIGLTNLVTAPKIVANNEEKSLKALKDIFADATEFSDPKTDFASNAKSYLVSYWVAKKDDSTLGYVYQTSGRNTYGKITLMVGLSGVSKIGSFSVLTNEQTLATTLEDKYLTPLSSAANKDTALTNVTCGATFGAKLVRDMILAAQSDYKGRSK